jgi:hypothetical protein
MSDRFERELKNALRPVDPGPDFTSSVMERLRTSAPAMESPANRASIRGKQRWTVGLTGMAASLIAAIGIVQVQERREEAEGLRARQQVLAALQVTSEKLNLAFRVANDQPGIEIDGDTAER